MEPLDGAGQELTVDCEYQMHYQFSWDLWQKGKISPHWTAYGLRKMILSEQVEAWLVLSECQPALACLLKFVQTCGLLEGVCQEI